MKVAVVSSGIDDLRLCTAGYTLRDVYNMGETDYYHSSVSDKSISATSQACTKSSKKRIVVAMTSNADGSARPSLLFIGSA